MPMALRDLLTEIDHLSLEEQLTLLEALTRRIRSTVHPSQGSHLRGILRPEGDLPTDEA
jgi:hypothetical protein